MAVAEPFNELWTAVKAISNPWPPDDEEQVAKLAEDWRKAGQTAHMAGTDLADARQASEQAWRDGGGGQMGHQLSGGVVTLEQQQREAEHQAALADRYAVVLTNVKTAIVQTIEANLPAYLQHGNPAYGAVGQAEQRLFAERIAAQLQAMVAGQTQGLHAPPAAPDTDTAVGQFGDWAAMTSAVAGGLALVPVLTPVAAPVALFAGAVALAAHAGEMIAAGTYDDANGWVGLAGDAAGMIPAGRAVYEVASAAAAAAPKVADIVSSGVDVLLQVPAALDSFFDNGVVDTVKDWAGDAGLGKTIVEEALEWVPTTPR